MSGARSTSKTETGSAGQTASFVQRSRFEVSIWRMIGRARALDGSENLAPAGRAIRIAGDKFTALRRFLVFDAGVGAAFA
jgi:hypothetical protein